MRIYPKFSAAEIPSGTGCRLRREQPEQKSGPLCQLGEDDESFRCGSDEVHGIASDEREA